MNLLFYLVRILKTGREGGGGPKCPIRLLSRKKSRIFLALWVGCVYNKLLVWTVTSIQGGKDAEGIKDFIVDGASGNFRSW
jgi:hypothetical protein